MKTTAQNPKAVILLGHGSRLPEASQSMQRVAHQLRALYGYAQVVVCHMELASPNLNDAFDECVASGQRDIVILPYFLHAGVHLTQDIPEMVEALRLRHPNTRVVIGPHLGFDESLVSLVHHRVQEATK
jgi:sirohydrochlorin ferrochelatase